MPFETDEVVLEVSERDSSKPPPGSFVHIRLTCREHDAPDAPSMEPQTITLIVTKPNGTPTNRQPVRDGKGKYHEDMQVTTPGPWRFRAKVDPGWVEIKVDWSRSSFA